MISPIFLGGTCGKTTWRNEIAIPVLEAAQLPYHNPQLPEGAWTPDHQYAEMEVKNKAEIWLFVLTTDTRGIASIGEVAYRIGQGGKIALAMQYFQPGAVLNGQILSQTEIDDLNRGRVFLQAMAEKHGVPVFEDIAAAAEYTVQLAWQAVQQLTLTRLNAILERTQVKGIQFVAEALADKFTIQVRQVVENTQTGQWEEMQGRRWLIEPEATESEIVRTLLKATLTWEEHEIRERFLFDGNPVFHPHFQITPPDDAIPHP